MIKLAPSILSADFAKMGSEIKLISDCGAHYVHIDVFDGHFAPNLSLGPALVKAVRPYSNKIFDVHLMLKKPKMFVAPFANAGADIINVHYECDEDLNDIFSEIKLYDKMAAITINPQTDVDLIIPYLSEISMVLVMSVMPGFSGQKFMENALPKLRRLKELKLKHGYTYDIEIDGGITLSNVETIIDAGGEIIVGGSSIFSEDGAEVEIQRFLKIFEKYNEGGIE